MVNCALLMPEIVDSPPEPIAHAHITQHRVIGRAIAIHEADDVAIRAILNHADGSALSHYCFKSFDSLTGPIQAYADWVWNLPGTIPEPEGRLDRPRVWDGTLN